MLTQCTDHRCIEICTCSASLIKLALPETKLSSTCAMPPSSSLNITCMEFVTLPSAGTSALIAFSCNTQSKYLKVTNNELLGLSTPSTCMNWQKQSPGRKDMITAEHWTACKGTPGHNTLSRTWHILKASAETHQLTEFVLWRWIFGQVFRQLMHQLTQRQVCETLQSCHATIIILHTHMKHQPKCY